MAINKVIFGGDVKLDLTGDTATADKVLNGQTFHDKSGVKVTGTCTYDSNTQDATASVAEILLGQTAYVRGVKYTGTMPNKGAISGEISNKDTAYTIAQGYHDGSGKVRIAQAEKNKLVPANIREGIQILGVTGTMSGSETVKAQSKTVTPKSTQQTVTPDVTYNYLASVTVEAIPYTESKNAAGGMTATIG